MANFNFNKVMLGGRLTADPELRQTQSGISNVRFSIAVNRRFQRQDQNADPNAPQKSDADFFNVVAWRQTAEFVARYFRKGSSIFVEYRRSERGPFASGVSRDIGAFDRR